jgi:ABC-type multidrug transport system fused ATPase/permease subunit
MDTADALREYSSMSVILRRSMESVLSALVFGLAGSVRSQISVHEGFEEYGAGAQLENGSNGAAGTGLAGGFGWAGAYDVNNAIKSRVKVENRASTPVVYENGEIRIHGGTRALRLWDDANGTPVLLRRLGRDVPVVAGGSVWFSFLFRTNNADPLANQDFLQVGFDEEAMPVAGNPRLSVGVNTTSTVFPPSQPFRFFARSGTNTAATAFDDSSGVSAGTTHLLVACIRNNGLFHHRVELHVNPGSLLAPPAPAAVSESGSGPSVLTRLLLRTSALDATDVYVLDELRVGFSYESVVMAEVPPLRLTWESASVKEPDLVGQLRWPTQRFTVLESAPAPDGPWEAVGLEGRSISGSDYLLPVAAHRDHPRRFFRLRD